MRKFIFSILLASAAASPALAQDHGRWHQDNEQGDRQAAHEQRQEQRQEAREQRSNGGGEAARVQQVQPQVQVETRRQQWQGSGQQTQAQQWQGRGGWDRSRSGNSDAQAQAQAQQIDQQRRLEGRNRGNWNGGFAGQAGQVQQNQTTSGWARDRGSWSHDRDGDFRQRQAEQQARDSSRWAQSGQQWSGNRYSGTWNRDWRNDRRYDWRRYRDSHRSIFRIGIYYDPFGYSYRRFNIGYSLPSVYFGQQYWIDPGLYQLPYPPPGTAWVRYWNDALLVDMYTGQVIDVIHDFFW